MNLVIFNEETLPTGPKKTPHLLSISKTGRFTLSKSATAMFSLEEGDKLSLCQDQNDSNWYLQRERKGFVGGILKGDRFSFVNEELADVFLNSMALERDTTYKFFISDEPVKFGRSLLFPINTDNLANTETQED